MQFGVYSIGAGVLLGGLSIVSSASAQSTNSTRHVASNNGTQTYAHGAVNCPPGCTPTSQCVTARVLTPAQRRALSARRQRIRDERERADQERLDAARADQARLDNEHCLRSLAERESAYNTQLQQQQAALADSERNRMALLADRNRIEQERIALLYRTPPARGGGPVETWRPHLVFGVEAGVGGYTGGMSQAVRPGPAWGARVGIAMTNWFMVEGRYAGMYNTGYDNAVGSGVAVVTQGGFGDMRFTIPVRYIQPYVFTGLGAYQTTLTGTDIARQQSGFNLHQSIAMPMGGGIDVPMGRHVGLLFEGSFTPLFNANGFNQNPLYDQGHMWNTTGLLHFDI